MKAMALEDTTWMEDAVATIIGIAHSQAELTADDVAKNLRQPPHPNHVGAAFSAARSQGYIRPIGYRTSTTPSRRHGVLRVWERTPNEGATR